MGDSDDAAETPVDPALAMTASVEDFDSVLLQIAAAPAIRPCARSILEPDPGEVIAQTYRVENRVAEGGMGAVYLARDIELDRPVALKVQSRPASADDLARLQREAKAMARLAHPNVVVVHEVGTHDGHLFIAMEFVGGGTARAFIDADPGWRATVELLIGVGQGLAAAHEVGIIHRDFKPENVMLGEDGRPRVADFGLARDTPTAGPAVEALGGGRLTATGAVMGTPAYMSPEQFNGDVVGPASDQFSFCVFAYEALFGVRPFKGTTSMEIAAAVSEGRRQRPPRGTRVPARLTSLILKGLRADPTQRHPSMAVLLERLERFVRARRRRVWLGVAAGVGVLASGFGYRAALALRPEPCEDLESSLDSAWGEARRAEVAAHVGPAVLAAVDDYANGWIRRRQAACEDTSVRGERSQLELSLKMACLDRHAAMLGGFADELAAGPATELRVEGVGRSLAPLEQCDDVAALEKLANPMSRRSVYNTAEAQAGWRIAIRLVARAAARQRLGREGALELAEEAGRVAQQHGVVEAEYRAMLVTADVKTARGQHAAADALRAQAIELAAEGADDALIADAVRQRAEQALWRRDISAGAAHMGYFDLFVRRVLQPEDRRRLEVEGLIPKGTLALERGDTAAAIEAFSSTLDHPEFVLPYAARSHLGRALLEADRAEDAVPILEEAIALRTEAGAKDDVELAGLLNNLANAQIALGDPATAAKRLERAHGIATRAEGEQRWLIATTLTNWGVAERERGDLPRARELQTEALQLFEAAHGNAHPSLAYATDELGELARIDKDFDGAINHWQRSLDLRQTAFGKEHPLVAASLVGMGKVFMDKGDTDTAAEAFGFAVGILKKTDKADELAKAEALLAKTSTP